MLQFHHLADFVSIFRIVRSRTLCAQRTYPHHVTPAHVLITCYRTAYSYVPVSFSRVLLLYWYGLSTRLCLRFRLMLTFYDSSTCLQTRYSWTYDSFTFHGCLYLYLAVWYIYGCGWGLVRHLQSTLQPPYKCDLWDPTYSPSSLLAHWPRLLLCNLLKGVHSPFSVNRLPVVKSSLCVYFGALVTTMLMTTAALASMLA